MKNLFNIKKATKIFSTYVITLLTLSELYSCRLIHEPDPIGHNIYTIINKSEQTIEIHNYSFDEYNDTIINKKNEITPNDSITKTLPIYCAPFYGADSVIIIFNDSIKINCNYKIGKHNLRYASNYDTTFFCDTLVKMRFVIDEDFYNFAKSQNK